MTAAVQSSRERVGTILDDKYRILRLIGEGGMGAVYEAEHLVIGHRVALKFLRGEYASNADLVARFMREARSAAAVGSDHIVGMVDVGKSPDGSPYMVMEYLEGESLGGRLAKVRPLPVHQAVDIAVQLCEGIDAAHQRGVVHRDMKPENIFLIVKGARRDFVKILDFGICKFKEGNDVALTTTGMTLGTPAYMPPEQARGDRDLDHRVDIYAIGTLLYLMTTGTLPYRADSYNALIVQIVTMPLTRPRERRPDVPVALEEIILKAMAPNKDERYEDAAEFAADLLGFVTSHPSIAAKMPKPGAESSAPHPRMASDFKSTAAGTPASLRSSASGASGRSGPSWQAARVPAAAPVPAEAEEPLDEFDLYADDDDEKTDANFRLDSDPETDEALRNEATVSLSTDLASDKTQMLDASEPPLRSRAPATPARPTATGKRGPSVASKLAIALVALAVVAGAVAYGLRLLPFQRGSASAAAAPPAEAAEAPFALPPVAAAAPAPSPTTAPAAGPTNEPAPAPATSPSVSARLSSVVHVRTVPAGAEISMDGQRVGTEPSDVVLPDLAPHQIVARKTGYADGLATVSAAGPSDVMIVLEVAAPSRPAAPAAPAGLPGTRPHRRRAGYGSELDLEPRTPSKRSYSGEID